MYNFRRKISSFPSLTLFFFFFLLFGFGLILGKVPFTAQNQYKKSTECSPNVCTKVEARASKSNALVYAYLNFEFPYRVDYTYHRNESFVCYSDRSNCSVTGLDVKEINDLSSCPYGGTSTYEDYVSVKSICSLKYSMSTSTLEILDIGNEIKTYDKYPLYAYNVTTLGKTLTLHNCLTYNDAQELNVFGSCLEEMFQNFDRGKSIFYMKNGHKVNIGFLLNTSKPNSTIKPRFDFFLISATKKNEIGSSEWRVASKVAIPFSIECASDYDHERKINTPIMNTLDFDNYVSKQILENEQLRINFFYKLIRKLDTLGSNCDTGQNTKKTQNLIRLCHKKCWKNQENEHTNNIKSNVISSDKKIDHDEKNNSLSRQQYEAGEQGENENNENTAFLFIFDNNNIIAKTSYYVVSVVFWVSGFIMLSRGALSSPLIFGNCGFITGILLSWIVMRSVGISNIYIIELVCLCIGIMFSFFYKLFSSRLTLISYAFVSGILLILGISALMPDLGIQLWPARLLLSISFGAALLVAVFYLDRCVLISISTLCGSLLISLAISIPPNVGISYAMDHIRSDHIDEKNRPLLLTYLFEALVIILLVIGVYAQEQHLKKPPTFFVPQSSSRGLI